MKKLLCSLFALGMVLTWSGVASGQGPGTGAGDPGTLSAAEEATLLHMREEEKLARDVYAEMYDTWAYKVFLNISGSEQNHMDAMLNMLKLYDLPDPAAGNGI